MGAVWILLSRSTHAAELIQSSVQNGVRTVSLPFEISAEYIPTADTATADELVAMTQGLPPIPAFESIIHRCLPMKRVIAKARRLAEFDVPVLIQGESGTGKELFARAIHEGSDRSERPFLEVNCGAIPSELIESELFGHKKGAFTGADEARTGYLEEADGGTLFLDEIGEMPATLQREIPKTRALHFPTAKRHTFSPPFTNVCENGPQPEHFIKIRNIGPIEELVVPCKPGVTVLRGPNTSTIVAVIKALASGEIGELRPREGHSYGTITTPYGTMRVGKSLSQRCKPGGFRVTVFAELAKLIDPGLKDLKAADRARLVILLRNKKCDRKAFKAFLGDELSKQFYREVNVPKNFLKAVDALQKWLGKNARKYEGEVVDTKRAIMEIAKASNRLDQAIDVDMARQRAVDTEHSHQRLAGLKAKRDESDRNANSCRELASHTYALINDALPPGWYYRKDGRLWVDRV
ncbi:MAG: sigma-54 factor interaction domain-containing protein [Fuerstiella sp.]|nr:sigma-54 factor interaction domain-containing protein [Fuerstiella sp.]MCP4853943.1 sigma-54 factor interaction domain-containing protein [Fuerstiella sp.]